MAAQGSRGFSDRYYQTTARLYLKAMDILRASDEVEGQYVLQSRPSLNVDLLPVAFAAKREGCLSAGWQGVMVSGRCQVTGIDFKSAAEACKDKGGTGARPCNPELFPGGVCIRPVDQGWTRACVTRFFELNGVSAEYQKDGSILMKPEEMTALGKRLKSNGVDLSKAVMDAEAVCFHVRLKDRSDCEALPKMYISAMQEASPSERQAIFTQQLGSPSSSFEEALTRKPSHLKGKSACSKIDNDLEKDTVYDQAWGSCYAYAATQVMNQGLIKKYGKDKAPLASAMATALQFGAFTGDHSSGRRLSSDVNEDHFLGTHGGWVGNALRATNTFGYCTESVFQSVNGENVQGNWAEFRIAFDRYQVEKKKAKQCGKPPPIGDLEVAMKPINEKILEEQKKIDPTRVATIESAMKTHYQFLLENSDDFDTFFFRYLQNICTASRIENRPVMAPPDAVQFTDRSVADQRSLDRALNAIHQDLESGNITAIGYFTDRLIYTPSSGHGMHASVVTGREYLDSGSPLLGGRKPGCYLVVKNSWGKEWPIQGSNNKNKNVIYDAERPGRFLVSETELSKAMFNYTEVIRK